ncbi:MAG TPA: Dabb family protein [Sphingobacteriaceae bacterium]
MFSSRRNFLAGFSRLAALTGLGSLVTFRSGAGDRKNGFIHHVYFWLKDPDNGQDLERLIGGLNKLSQVKTIREWHIGKPAGTRRDVIDSSYSVSWMLVFDDRTAQDQYQTDPIHLNFVETCSHLWEKVVVYDTEPV